MHTQLETTRIHIATSDRPIYTLLCPEVTCCETTFLAKVSMHVDTCSEQNVPIREEHGNIHGSNSKNDVEPRILQELSISLAVIVSRYSRCSVDHAAHRLWIRQCHLRHPMIPLPTQMQVLR